MKNKKRIIYTLLIIMWCSIIFSFSNANGESSGGLSLKITQYLIEMFYPSFYKLEVITQQSILDGLHLLIRKLAHMTEYAILYFFVYQWMTTFYMKKIKLYMYPFVFSVSYAFLDEFHQLFIDGRAGSLVDVSIDTIGILCMLGLIFLYEKWRKRKLN